MARPSKCRRICSEPAYDSFVPEGISCGDKVVLTIDEYEIIRLIDLGKFTHEQCAKQMDISRTTVTEGYESARTKIADSIVNGKTLLITGGHYRLCDGSAGYYCLENCRKWRNTVRNQAVQMKGANEMRIAVTYEDGKVFQHFGHTAQFKFYDIEEKKVVKEQLVDTNGQGHGALSGFLSEAKVDILICGGIGAGAQNALANAGIQLLGGVSGSADDAVGAYLEGTLSFDSNVHCKHHEHEHSCGEHHCNEDKHGCSGNIKNVNS